ncbi:helix-turn-helix domain-containing protein [Streptomyces sp. NPDC058293]|uniref:AraC-like ligand-binding domain-containing protein n=1 Tax=Streptomyces sp. NPDC058293 TaxID=3346429 RepID=UPI0036E25C8A
MRSYVSTDTLTPAERFPHWAHQVSGVFGGIDIRRASRDPFHGTATSDAVGRLRLSSVSAAPVRVRRTERPTARCEEDHYKVALQVSGTCVVEQDGVRGELPPGSIAICDNTRPYSFRYDSAFRIVLMSLPRPMVPVRPEAMRAVTARPLPTDSGVGAVVGPFLRSLGEQPRVCSGPAGASLMDGAASLMSALVTEALERAAPTDPQQAPQQAMMLRIRSHIESRLGDPGLTPDSIAEAHGVSRRYLFKLFAAEGLTVAGLIRARRLERCAHDLASPATADQPIGVVAARWGLVDGRHFSRVFKSAYGQPPREYRRDALAGADYGRIRTEAEG